jgi:hypothetical protein
MHHTIVKKIKLTQVSREVFVLFPATRMLLSPLQEHGSNTDDTSESTTDHVGRGGTSEDTDHSGGGWGVRSSGVNGGGGGGGSNSWPGCGRACPRAKDVRNWFPLQED